MKIVTAILIYLILINIITFANYRSDKLKAKMGWDRISERRLLLLAVCGGGVGAFAGMRIYHHKTRKWRFRILVPLCMIIQILLLISLLGFSLYVSDYYHAGSEAASAMQSDEEVQVKEIRTGTLFDGPGEENAVIFYPGAKVEETAYAPLLHRAAADGTDCFLVNMPGRLAFFGKNKAKRIIKDKNYSYDNWYMMGHSLGGAMAAEFCADSKNLVTGLILLAAYPVKNLKSESFRLLSIYGSEDKVLNMKNYEENRENWPEDAQEYIIDGGNHAGFGEYGPQNGDGSASISQEEQQSQTARMIHLFITKDR